MLVLGATTMMTSCKKEGCMDTTATNYNAEAKKDNGTCNYVAATTGGLKVKVQISGTTGYATDAIVGLSASLVDLDNSIYLQEVTTDANGSADFGQMNSGNYYFDADVLIGSVSYYGEGSVQIIIGTDLDLTLTLNP